MNQVQPQPQGQLPLARNPGAFDHVPIIQSSERLAQLSDEDRYNTFYVPVLRKLANDAGPAGAEFRQELFQAGGPGQWAICRAQGFLQKTRPGSQSVSDAERKLRDIESRVCVELCFRGCMDQGIGLMIAHHPSLGSAINLENYRKIYSSAAASTATAKAQDTIRGYHFPRDRRSYGVALGELTPDVSQWSTTDVREFLCQQGLSDYSELFQSKTVSGPTLLAMNSETLALLGMRNRAHRTKLLHALALCQKRCSLVFSGFKYPPK